MKISLLLPSLALGIVLLAPQAHAGTRAPRPLIPYDQTLYIRQNHIIRGSEYVVPRTSTVGRCVYLGSNGQCQVVGEYFTNVRTERPSDYRLYLVPDPSAVNPRGSFYNPDPYLFPVGERRSTRPRSTVRSVRYAPIRSYDAHYRSIHRPKAGAVWREW